MFWKNLVMKSIEIPRLWNVLYAEMKEAIPAAMNGLDGIKDLVPEIWVHESYSYVKTSS